MATSLAVDPAALPDTVYEVFRASAARWRGNPFLHIPASACAGYADGPVEYNYEQALSEIEALHACYRDAGFGAGMRVALLLENRPAFFFHWFALNALGVSVVPLNPEYRAGEMGFLLAHSESVAAIALPERIAAVRAAAEAGGVRIAVIDESRVRGSLPRIEPRIDAQAPAGRFAECGLLYTSGTTGKPKGCILSNDYFLRAGARYANRGGYIRVEPGKARVLTPLPLFHMNAMGGSTMGMVTTGGCVIQLDRFHPQTWWRDVGTTRATGVHYLGVMPAILLKLPEVREEREHCVAYGTGANVEPEHHAAFEKRFGFPLVEGWAMTETGSSGAISADHEPRHVGTRCFGKPGAEVEVRLVDEQGNDVPDGEPGELLVRRAGKNCALGFFSGYLKDPQATAAGWAGGWWHSGDMVRRGPDGALHFVDRRKNVIRRGGENISALEVETALLRHPAVAQVAISAVHDALRGEEVIAFVVPGASAARDEDAARAIAQWALAEMAYYKVPGWIAFVDALPVTATQKIQRGELRALAERALHAPGCHDLRGMKKRVA
ncbi:MAG TPA: AMP-binding protein [Burkholderiales bacterium]|nr:AMP-binding protein [Burkholderiales bacterium]